MAMLNATQMWIALGVMVLLLVIAAAVFSFMTYLKAENATTTERVWDDPVTLLDTSRILIANPDEYGNYSRNEELSDVPDQSHLGPIFSFSRAMGTSQVRVLEESYAQRLGLGKSLRLCDLHDFQFVVQHQAGNRSGNSLQNVETAPPSGVWEVQIACTNGATLHGVSRQSVEESNMAHQSDDERDVRTLYGGFKEDVVHKASPTLHAPFKSRLQWAVTTTSAHKHVSRPAISMTFREAVDYADEDAVIESLSLRLYRNAMDQNDDVDFDQEDAPSPAQFRSATVRFDVPSGSKGGHGKGPMGRLNVYPQPFEDPDMMSFRVTNGSSYTDGTGVNASVEVTARNATDMEKLAYLASRAEGGELEWTMELMLPASGSERDHVLQDRTVSSAIMTTESPMTLTWPDANAFVGNTIVNDGEAWLRVTMSAESRGNNTTRILYRSPAINITNWSATAPPSPPVSS